MVTFSAGSVATRINERLPNLPAGAGEIGSGIILANIVTDLVNDVVNFTGDTTLTATSIPEKYQNILISAGCAYAVASRSALGVGFNVSLGEFSVDRGESSPEARLAAFYAKQASESLRFLGRNIAFKSTFY